MLHAHLDRQAAAHLAVINAQRPQLGLAVGDGNVPRSVVAQQDHIVHKIVGIKLAERAARAQAVQNLHGLRVLDLQFSGHRNPAPRQQAVAHDDGTQRVFVFLDSRALVVVGKRA